MFQTPDEGWIGSLCERDPIALRLRYEPYSKQCLPYRIPLHFHVYLTGSHSFSQCNDPFEKLRWDRNASTGQVPLLELENMLGTTKVSGSFEFRGSFLPDTRSDAGRQDYICSCEKSRFLTPVAGPIFETKIESFFLESFFLGEEFLEQHYAGRRTGFRDKKIERFFWREFSGEKLLPENITCDVLGQKSLKNLKSSSNVLIWIESCWLPNREGNYCQNCVLFLKTIQTKEHGVKIFFFLCLVKDS